MSKALGIGPKINPFLITKGIDLMIVSFFATLAYDNHEKSAFIELNELSLIQNNKEKLMRLLFRLEDSLFTSVLANNSIQSLQISRKLETSLIMNYLQQNLIDLTPDHINDLYYKKIYNKEF